VQAGRDGHRGGAAGRGAPLVPGDLRRQPRHEVTSQGETMKKTLLTYATAGMAAITVLLLPGICRASEATDARAEWARFLDEFPAMKGKSSESERLKTLFEREWDYSLKESPELSTALGIPGRNHLWGDYSLATQEARRALNPKLVAAIESIDRSK